MPAISISAVNAGTDTLTAVAHGLLTGDRARVRNVGGALPTGTAAVTDYFAIRVDADNLKLATSSAAALAGTPVVDITGAGSGTNTVEYGLPYCIPTAVAAVGTQIKSANDNGVWNALVALYALVTGQTQTVVANVSLPKKHGTTKKALAPKIVNNVVGLTWTLNTGDFVTSTGAGTAQLDVPCEVGDRITGIEVLAFGDGVVDATITLDYLDTSLVATNIATLADNNRAAAWGFAIPSVTAHTMADGERLRLSIAANAANYRVGQVKLIYDRP
jgi:hypothetical protein